MENSFYKKSSNNLIPVTVSSINVSGNITTDSFSTNSLVTSGTVSVRTTSTGRTQNAVVLGSNPAGSTEPQLTFLPATNTGEGSVWMYVNATDDFVVQNRVSGAGIQFLLNGGGAPMAVLAGNGSIPLFQITQSGGAESQVRSIVDVTDPNALWIRKDGNTGTILNVNTTSDVVTMNGSMVYRVGVRNGSGAAPITGLIVSFGATGVGNAVTLANGTVGQTLQLVLSSKASGTHTAIVTPTTALGFTTITLSVLGSGCCLVYLSTGWAVVSNNQCVIA